MIIKKPYAFLIKHFRLIHLFLSAFILYLVYKTNNIFVFFNDYVKSGHYTVSNELNGGYINLYMIFCVAIVLVLSSFIYLLMRWKKKNRLFYISLCIFYFCLFVGLLFYFNVLYNIMNLTLDIRTIRAYRDIIMILYFPQYIFLVFSIIRAIGFDLKKFDFKKDLEDLDIAEEDQEEIEVTFNGNSYKAKRAFRKIFREVKYYIVENKFFFAVICGTITLILGLIIYTNSSSFNRTYRESEFFMIDGVTFRVINSYVTDVDYKGSSISKDKKYFVIKTSMENTNESRTNLETNNLRLILNGKNYYPVYSVKDYFKDLGEVYNKNTLYAGEIYEYLFIYEIPLNEEVKKAYFSLLDSVNILDGEIKSKSKDVRLRPIMYMSGAKSEIYKVGDAISLENSSLLNSELLLGSYEINNSFSLEYSYCTSKCYTGKEVIKPDVLGKYDRTILKLNLDIDIDPDLNVDKILKGDENFIEMFGSVSYSINDVNKNSSIIVKRLNHASSDSVFVEVPLEVKNANKLKLNINIRNKKYMIELK